MTVEAYATETRGETVQVFALARHNQIAEGDVMEHGRPTYVVDVEAQQVLDITYIRPEPQYVTVPPRNAGRKQEPPSGGR